MEKYSSASLTTSVSSPLITMDTSASGKSFAAATNSNPTSAQIHSTTEKIFRMRAMSFLPQYWAISTAEPLTRPVTVAV